MARSLSFALTVALVAAAACAAPAEDAEEAASVEDELALRKLCAGAGTETYEGIDGHFARRGAKRSGELERLVISGASPASSPRDASYTATVTRSCSEPGCRVESGAMTLLPDNAAFPNSFGFYKGASPDSSAPGELYFVLGALRIDGLVTEMCLARVASSQDVGRPFALKRIPPP